MGFFSKIDEMVDDSIFITGTLCMAGVLLGSQFELNFRESIVWTAMYTSGASWAFRAWREARGHPIEMESCRVNLYDLILQFMFILTLNIARFYFSVVKVRRNDWDQSRIYIHSMTQLINSIILMFMGAYGQTPQIFEGAISEDCDIHSWATRAHKVLEIVTIICKYMMVVRMMTLISVNYDMVILKKKCEQQNADFKEKLIKSVSREPYSAEKFVHDKTCSICFKDYVPNEQLTRLKCDHRHYFHTSCLIQCFDHKLNKCPLCQALILPDELDSPRTEYDVHHIAIFQLLYMVLLFDQNYYFI